MIKVSEIKKSFNQNSLLKNLGLSLVSFFGFLTLFYGFFILFGYNSILYLSLAAVLSVGFILLFILALLRPDVVLLLSLFVAFNPYYAYITLVEYWDKQFIRVGIGIFFIVLLSVVILLKAVVKKKITRIKTPIDKLLIIFSIFLVIGTIYGLWQRYPPRIIAADLVPLLEFIAFFFLSTFIIRDEKQAKRIIFGSLIWLILIEIGELIFYFTGGYQQLAYDRTLAGMKIMRLTDFMALIAFSLLAGLYLSPDLIKKRSFLILVSFIPFIVLILSFFRSLWLGTIFGLIFIFLMVGKYKKTLKTVALSLVILGIVLSAASYFLAKEIFYGQSLFPMIVEGMGRILPFGTGEAIEKHVEYSRIYQMKQFLQVIYENPLIGTGFGPDTSAANYYLEIAYKMGIPALIFFLFTFFIFFKKSIYIFRLTDPGINKRLRLGILTSFVAVAVILLVYPGIGHFPIMTYLGVMGASFFALNSNKKK